MTHRGRRAKAGHVAHPIDAEIGRKIAQRRTQLGMSLAALAAKLNVTVQRVQNFESGRTSIRASELVAVGLALDVTVFHFFEEEKRRAARLRGGTPVENRGQRATRSEETQELLHAYDRIQDPESRRMLAKVVQKLAAGYGDAKEAQPVTRKRRAASSPPRSGWLN